MRCSIIYLLVSPQKIKKKLAPSQNCLIKTKKAMQNVFFCSTKNVTTQCLQKTPSPLYRTKEALQQRHCFCVFRKDLEEQNKEPKSGQGIFTYTDDELFQVRLGNWPQGLEIGEKLRRNPLLRILSLIPKVCLKISCSQPKTYILGFSQNSSNLIDFFVISQARAMIFLNGIWFLIILLKTFFGSTMKLGRHVSNAPPTYLH